MQATFARAELFRALDIASLVAEKRATIPVLQHVSIAARDGVATIRATDLDIEATISVRADMPADFAALVPAHRFRDLAKASGAESMTLTAANVEPKTEKDRAFSNLDLDFGDSRASMTGLPFEDFPTMDLGEVKCNFDMPCDTLADALAKTHFAISTEEARYYLNGVFMQPVRDQLRVISTDGHRMAHWHCALPAGAEEIRGPDRSPGAIVPAATVALLRKLLKPTFSGAGKAKIRTSPETVKISVTPKRIRFTIGNVEIVSKMIDGSFPDYERVTPRGNSKIATIDKAALAAALAAFPKKAAGYAAVKFAFEAEKLTLSTNDPDNGTAMRSLPCAFNGVKPLDIGFNNKYALDILAAIEGATVTLRLQESGSPVIFEGAGERTLFVLMPMRV